MLAVTPKPDLTLPAQASPLKVMITRALDRILFPPLLAKWKDLIAECVTPKKIPMFKQELAEQLQQYRQEILRYLDPILLKCQHEDEKDQMLVEMLAMLETFSELSTSPTNTPIEKNIDAGLSEVAK